MSSKKTALLLDLSGRLARYLESESGSCETLKNLYLNVAPFTGDIDFVHLFIQEFLLPHFDRESNLIDMEALNERIPSKFKTTQEETEEEEGIPPQITEKMAKYFIALCDVYTTS